MARPITIGSLVFIHVVSESDPTHSSIKVARGASAGLLYWLLWDHLMIILPAMALYSKSAGKNVNHASITEGSTLTALSNIAAEIFDYETGNGTTSPYTFTSITDKTRIFDTREFAIFPSSRVLCMVGAPVVENTTVTLSASGAKCFAGLNADLKVLRLAFKELNRQQRGNAAEADEN